VSALPRVSGREVVKALQNVGYEKDRQRGSHIVLRQAGLTVDEFDALL
jgi:predicted RNA binding protein YcfA (HicA-like mRNA interferase family)